MQLTGAYCAVVINNQISSTIKCNFTLTHTMATLMSLSLLLHVEITRQLDLRDALSYSRTCTTAHDAVYHVFAHRHQLDFHSVLNGNGDIALPHHLLMKVLHAHVRATSIAGFSLRSTFTMFKDLYAYFNSYWQMHTNRYGNTVGHPSGNLVYVSLNKKYGISHSAPPATRHLMYDMWTTLDHTCSYISLVDTSCIPTCQTIYDNWSTTDLDIWINESPSCLICYFGTCYEREY